MQRFRRAAEAPGGQSRQGVASRPRAGAPDPALVAPPRPSTEGMRRLGARPAEGVAAAGAAGVPQGVAGDYAVGQRVEHPKFGAGTILRIETLAADHKLVVDFGTYGEKTLLAKFAKLTKLGN